MDALVAVSTLNPRNPIGEIVYGAGLPVSHYLPCDGISTTENPAAVAALGNVFPALERTACTEPSVSSHIVKLASGRIVAFSATSDTACQYSDVGGLTWKTGGIPYSSGANSVSHVAVTGTTLVACMGASDVTVLSTNGGVTWSTARSVTTGMIAPAFFGYVGSRLWMIPSSATCTAVCYSDNNGATWTSKTVTSSDTTRNKASVGSTNGLLLLTVNTNTYYSTNNGTTLASTTAAPSGEAPIRSLIYHNGLYYWLCSTVLLTSTNGAAWTTRITYAGDYMFVRDGAVCTMDQYGKLNLVDTSVWVLLSVGQAMTAAAATAYLNDDTVLLHGDSTSGIYVYLSVDGGYTWAYRTIGLAGSSSGKVIADAEGFTVIYSGHSARFSLNRNKVQAPGLNRTLVNPETRAYMRIA